MSDRQGAWRPTLPPKRNSVNVGVNNPSEAIRGAAQLAFKSRPSTATTTPSTKRALSSSAISAAAAAGSARNQAPPSTSDQNATNTSATSFAAYARGRPPPGVQNPSSELGALFGPTLSPLGNNRARQTSSPGGSPSQIAARMASTSRSPARRTLKYDDSGDRPSMPRDQSALLAGKFASLRSLQEASEQTWSHGHTSATSADQPPLNLKKIPYLPKKSPASLPSDPSAGKLAGAAAAQAAVIHARLPVAPPSPRPEVSQDYFPLTATEFSSPERSLVGACLDSPSTMVTLETPVESEHNSLAETLHESGYDLHRSAPIPIYPRRSPGFATSTSGSYVTDYRTGLTDSSHADAIVASSLASSRAPSPTKVDPLARSSRRSRSHSYSHPTLPLLPHHLLHHEKVSDLTTRTSHAPPRNLKQTLRKHSSHKDDEEEETTKRGRKHFMRKHPHKHHEGDRKRWRDKITERERRRYEGVWAANRGLFTFWEEDPAFGQGWQRHPDSDLVVNVVVRDVWERSRLYTDVLEEIWDLVAPSEDAQALQRDQFVVGLWLIDQRLKGRKLPVRVSSDVWNSVRHTQGVKVSRKPY